MDDEFEDRENWYSEESSTLGDRIAAGRDAVGMTQAKLAKRLGVKVKTVHGWEDDLEGPRANRLQMLAGILGVSVMWLLTGQGDGLSSPEEAVVLPSDVRDILADIRLMKSELNRSADRLGKLEKKLRMILKDPKA